MNDYTIADRDSFASSAEAVAIVQNNHRVMVVIDTLLRILSHVTLTSLPFCSVYLN